MEALRRRSDATTRRRERQRRPGCVARAAPPRARCATGCSPSSASSVALGDHLVAPPRALDALGRPTAPRPQHARRARSTTLGRRRRRASRRGERTGVRRAAASPTGAGCSAIAGRDLHRATRPAELPEAAAALADLAEAALEAALAIARAEHAGDGRAAAGFAVIGMGKTRRPRAQLRQRRRRHLRGRAAATGVERGRRPSRPATQLATAPDAGLLDVDRPRARCGRSTPRCARRARTARWCARSPSHRRLLRAVGQDLGVPGAAQGPPGRRRPRARGRPTSTRSRPLVWQAAERDNFVEDVQAMRRRVEEHVPADRGRPPAQARPGRPARRRVQRAAAAARARPGRRVAAHAARRWRRSRRWPPAATSAATTPRASTRPTGCCARWSTGSSCTGCAAPTSCRPTRPTCAGSGRALGHRRRPGARGGARSGSARPARCAGCTSGSSTARCSPPSPG